MNNLRYLRLKTITGDKQPWLCVTTFADIESIGGMFDGENRIYCEMMEYIGGNRYINASVVANQMAEWPEY